MQEADNSFMLQGPVTIKDIARHLKISPSTVSRALRDLPDVKKETREAVKKLATKLEYQPNTIAQGLVKKRSFNIGVVIPDFRIHFFASALSGIFKAANEAGYNVMVSQTNESYTAEIKSVQALVSNRVDGLIFALSRETQKFDHINQIIRQNIPVIIFNRMSEEIAASKVLINDYEGGLMATSHLIDCGCRNLAHLSGPPNLEISRQRQKGFADAITRQGLKVDTSLILDTDFTIDSGYEAMKNLISSGKAIDGVFAVNDPVAYGAIAAMKEVGIKIPEEVSIVGFTNEPFARLIEPKLTTVSQPMLQIGEEATKLLIQYIEKGKPALPETRVFGTELIIRDSTRYKKH
ncbi:MAG: LacI family DNA-binding transcriptional regulator [Cyclobacteriaceae bacterium]|nr:LacI family DNA-binding transcriptional regulator [Cyclobacteriaceae bacterium]